MFIMTTKKKQHSALKKLSNKHRGKIQASVATALSRAVCIFVERRYLITEVHSKNAMTEGYIETGWPFSGPLLLPAVLRRTY